MFTNAWVQKKVGNLLNYTRPEKYITKLKEPLEKGKIPILTANNSFILGYTNEINFFDRECIIFDDFTLLNKYVDFRFMVKSSAIKILELNNSNNNLFFIFLVLNSIKLTSDGYNRDYIQKIQNLSLNITKLSEQNKIANFLNLLNNYNNLIKTKISKIENIKNTLLNKMFADETLFPAIRFKEFTNTWYQEKIDNLFKWYSIRNNESNNLTSYTISNTLGFINQKAYFLNGGKSVNANKNTSKSILPNSFAFNPSRIDVCSLAYYNNVEKGLISNIYEVFHTTNVIDDKFINFYFKTLHFSKLKSSNTNTGIRNTFSLKNIKDEVFFITNLDEQIQNSKLLNNINFSVSLLKRKWK
nr:restriction endonuclease subunit S [Mycoplasma miroungirhinis]